MKSTELHTKISSLPLELKTEVNDFIDFLLSKQRKVCQEKKPVFGCAKGQVIMSPDFDEPLEDFKEYMQ